MRTPIRWRMRLPEFWNTMNADHQDALILLARVFAGTTAQEA